MRVCPPLLLLFRFGYVLFRFWRVLREAPRFPSLGAVACGWWGVGVEAGFRYQKSCASYRDDPFGGSGGRAQVGVVGPAHADRPRLLAQVSSCVWGGGGLELIILMALPCAVWRASYPAWRRCIYLGERNGMPAYSISCLFKPAPSTPHKYLAAPICVRKDVTLTMCVCGGA